MRKGQMGANRHLGEFLRTHRQRLDPVKLGLSVARRRRTQGLRREEVAELAGISCEWYIKLEQGRDVAPSEATLAALGAALRLDSMELAHLHLLATVAVRQPFSREDAPDTLCRIVATLPEPAYLTGQRLDVLCLNDAAADLFGNFGQLVTADRNILHWMLTDVSAKRVFGRSWADEARRIVYLFRASHDLWPGDTAFSTLVNEVRASCPEFEAWWSEHRVAAPLFGTKELHHPTRGVMRYEYASFQANDDAKIKLSLYTQLQGAAASRTRQKRGSA